MDTLSYILRKYDIARLPIEIPNAGREDLSNLFAELKFTVGVEVGTESGKFAESLCRVNPDLHLFCIDPWLIYEDNKGYKMGVSQSDVDSYYNTAKEVLSKYNVTFIKEFSSKAVNEFEDESLDFVYLDGNHRLEYVIEDINIWLPKVKIGGIISGHDYIQFIKQNYSHVVEALNAYTRSYLISPWFILGTKSKTEGEIRDPQRSWFWVKK